MIGIFKQKNPANIILLLVFGVLIKLPMFLYPHIPVQYNDQGFLYKAILVFLEKTGKGSPVLYAILAYFLLYLQAIFLNQFINNQRMMSRASYFPGMAYLMVTSLFPEWNYFSAPLITNTILLIILSGIFRSYNKEPARGSIFNIGLLLGIAAFIFFPSITLIVWLLLAIAVMRPFRLNEWMLCLVGVLTPTYFYAVYLFITDQWSWHNLWPTFVISLPSVKQSAWLAGSVFLLTVPFLMGGYYVQNSLRKMLIQVRKGWSLILLFLLGAIFIPFINNSDTFMNWIMAAIPFAAFHSSTYFYARFRIIPLVLFWLTIGFVLVYQYAGPGW